MPMLNFKTNKMFTTKAGDIMKQKKRLPELLIFFPLNHIQSIEIDNFDDLEFTNLVGVGL